MAADTLVAGAPGRDRAAAPNKWLVTLAVLMGALMGAIDTSVVNVALVHIQASYGVTFQQVAWVSTSYLITVVLVMPLTAWLGTVIGRKRVYLWSVVIFTVASAFCGLSRTLGQLIFFRVVQGLGGGALQPIAQAIMRESFPAKEQGQAMGFFGMIVLLGPAIGPTLGGWLTDNYSWPWIFFVNLPIGVLGLMLGSRFIVDPLYMRGRGLGRFDYLGVGLLTVGLVSLQILLEEGERDGWFTSPFILTLTVIAIPALIAFVFWELRTPIPVVDLRVLRDVTFASGSLIMAIVGVVLFGGLILLPLFLQNLLRYDATQAGLALMPRSLVMVLLMPVAGVLYNRVGLYVMLPFGLITSGIAGLMMARFNLDSGPLQILLPQVVQGIGFAFMFVPLATASLSTIPLPQMQSAAGLFNLVRQLGGSLGTAIVITLLDHRTTIASAGLMRYASPYNPTFMHWWQSIQAGFVAHGSDPATARMRALATLHGLISRQASVIAFDYVFAVIAIVFFVCLPLVLLMRSGRSQEAAAPAE